MKNCSWSKSWNLLCGGSKVYEGRVRKLKEWKLSFVWLTILIAANQLFPLLWQFTALPLAKHTYSIMIDQSSVRCVCNWYVSGSCPQAAFCSAALWSISYSVSDSDTVSTYTSRCLLPALDQTRLHRTSLLLLIEPPL